MQDFEKLGVFYLGKVYRPETDTTTDELLLYDSKDLTTHAVIIGMTGSGKTGLGIGLLEEAALDHIPVIAIDPKGDLGNILLAFPELSGADLAPWVNPREAASRGMTPEQYAHDQAALWRRGLEEWGQSTERIEKLRAAAEMAIYTPGSSAGIPMSVLGSFAAPTTAVRDDPDLYRERIAATATSILALVDVDADPLTSREHILVANLLQQQWDQGRDLDIPGLISAIQQPPFERIGVMNLDDFFPPKDRFALAMRLNNLLAAPGFDVWMQGDALDAERLLHTDAGRPRVSVVSIAHLDDAQRLFFVTMLLNEIISWMRRQPGTGSLRAILYMDEIFGFLPPTANPPTKTLFLTLLKQARAYGLGLVLATQNPVDLDYKALSNAGTWFIGRLQTERDKARVMEGLEGASAGAEFDRGRMQQILAGLGKRRFLLHNVHEDRPVLFSTRWVMSYLAGPFTRDQIKRLSGERPRPESRTAPSPRPVPSAAATQQGRPALPPKVRQFYLPARRSPQTGERLVYCPYLLGIAQVDYDHRRYEVRADRRVSVLTQISGKAVPVSWEHAESIDLSADELQRKGVPESSYATVPAAAGEVGNYAKWEKGFSHWLRREQILRLYRCRELKAMSEAGESEGAFRARLQVLANERRDMEVGKLRKKYDAKVTRLENQLLRAQQRVATEQEQSEQSKVDTAIAFGTAVLGAFLGRKRVSATSARSMGSALRRAKRIGKEADDVEHAKERVAALMQQHDELNTEFEADVARIEQGLDAQALALEEVQVRPKVSDIHVKIFGLAWVPCYQDSTGVLTPAVANS